MIKILVTFDWKRGRGWYEMTMGIAWLESYAMIIRTALAGRDPKVFIVGWDF